MALADWIAPGVVLAGIGLVLTVKSSRDSARERREAPQRAAERATRGQLRELLVEASALFRESQKRLGRGELLEDYPTRLVAIADEVDAKRRRLSKSTRLLAIGTRMGMVQARWMGVQGQSQTTSSFEALDALADATGADVGAELKGEIKGRVARGPMAEGEARRRLAVALDAALDELDDIVAWIDDQDRNT